MAALIGEDLPLGSKRVIAADAERAPLAPKRDEAAVKREDGARLLREALDVAGPVPRVERQPRLARREARVRRGVPLHRRALGVAAEPQARLVDLPRVADALRRDVHPR